MDYFFILFRFLFHHASWHWGDDSSRGSEHHLNSRQFPAEIQLYHYNSEAYNSYENALGKPKGVVALSFFYELSNTDNADLDNIWQNIKDLDDLLQNMGMEFEQAVPGMQLNQLLPRGGVGSSDSYFYYSGSLTQPDNSTDPKIDCSESVQWINYEKTIQISEIQLGTLRALLSTINLKQEENYDFRPTCSSNFRPLHQLNPSQTARAPSPVVGRRKARKFSQHNIWLVLPATCRSGSYTWTAVLQTQPRDISCNCIDRNCGWDK